MARSLDDLGARAALVDIARDFHARGWMAGTAGNLSARDDEHHFWITASGKPKGVLDEGDFLLIRIADGAVLENARAQNAPSAETAIHRMLYQLFPRARACLHGHSVAACLAADRAGAKAKSLRLPALEMLKGFDIWEEKPKVELPLFVNTLDVDKVAHAIDKRFRKKLPRLDALLIRGHGATVWGRGLQEAYNRFEILDFLLRYVAGARAA